MSQAWFTILASGPAGVALKSAMILAAARLITLLMRTKAAGARHLVWTTALAAALALPLLTVSLPALKIATPVFRPETGAAFGATAIAADNAASSPAASARALSQARGASRVDWRSLAMLIWVLGAAAALLRMAIGYFVIWRLRRKLKPFPDAGGTGVLEAPSGTMPMTVGVVKPVVLLPSDAIGWSDDRRRAVLLHELAHVRRGDPAMQLLARTAVAMYWWNPLAWIAWREFVKERERAADDVVLGSGFRASDYAAHLLEIARSFRPAMAMGVAMARRSQLEGRLLAILDSNAARRAPGRVAASIAAITAMAIIAPLAAVRAQESPAIPADVDAAIRAAKSQRDNARLERIARVAQDQRKFDLAHRLLEAGLEIRGEVSGTTSQEYGIGVFKLAEMTKRQNGVKSAEPLYTQAAALLGNRPEAATALINLGEAALLNKNLEAAAGYFERARSGDPSKTGMALMWLADVRARQGNAAEADALFKNAVAVEDPSSLDAAVIRTVYAKFLAKQNRDDEAADLRKSAAATYGIHSAHPAAAQSGVYKIGADVKSPQLLTKVEPEYSEEARAALLDGSVRLSVVIGVDGVPQDIVVVQPLGLGLDEKAVEAVSQWKFSPGTKDGGPVPVFATIVVNFRLL